MSEELCCLKDKEEGIVSLGDFHIEHVHSHLAILTVRVVVMEYSQLHKKAYTW